MVAAHRIQRKQLQGHILDGESESIRLSPTNCINPGQQCRNYDHADTPLSPRPIMAHDTFSRRSPYVGDFFFQERAILDHSIFQI